MIDRIIAEAEGRSRPVVIVPTASTAKSFAARIEAPTEARSTAAALTPQPFAPDRLAAAGALDNCARRRQGRRQHRLAERRHRPRRQGGRGRRQAARSRRRAAPSPSSRTAARPSRSALRPASARAASWKRACCARSGGARNGFVHAISTRGQSLAEAPFKFTAGAAATTVPFELPLELRNQVGRVEIAGERSAGAVSLIDCALAVAPRGAHLRREPRAGAAAAGAALLHREGAQPVRRADQAEGLQPRRRHQGGAVAERQRARCSPTSARCRAKPPSTSRIG